MTAPKRRTRILHIATDRRSETICNIFADEALDLATSPASFLAIANREMFGPDDLAICTECEIRELVRSNECGTCGYRGTKYHADWCPVLWLE